MGNPAKIVKDVSDDMITWKADGTRLYQSLPGQMRETLKATEPLREVEPDRPTQQKGYLTWKERGAK